LILTAPPRKAGWGFFITKKHKKHINNFMETFSTWLEGRGQYVIKHRAIDGKSSQRFSSLQAVAKYVKGWDMGPDYRRPWGLQDEMGQLIFVGFSWEDIMDGSPYDIEGVPWGRYKFGLDPAPLPSPDDGYPDDDSLRPDSDAHQNLYGRKAPSVPNYGASGQHPPF
jgi:hypothetical protein